MVLPSAPEPDRLESLGVHPDAAKLTGAGRSSCEQMQEALHLLRRMVRGLPRTIRAGAASPNSPPASAPPQH